MIVPVALRVPPVADLLYSAVFVVCGFTLIGFWLSDKAADLKREKRYFANKEKEADS